MIYEQLSLFDQVQPDEIRTPADFVRAAYRLWEDARKRGWCRPGDTFQSSVQEHFRSYRGGTAPAAFAGWQFYDYSPKGVRLQNFETGRELKFTKAQILKEIEKGVFV